MARPEETLRKVLTRIIERNFPSDSTFTIAPVSSTGANYTATLFEATVNAASDEYVELFAKVASMPDALGAFIIFDIEKKVYSNLVSTYEKLQNKHLISGVDRYVFPKYYGCNESEGAQTIVVENLTAGGYEAFDRFKYIDWEYASKAMETIAKFHALSLALRIDRPEEYQKVVELFHFPAMNEGTDEWTGLLDGALAAVDVEDRDRVARCLEGCVNWSKLTDLCEPRKTAVIIHGDYRPSNLMHKMKDGRLLMIPVDYQMVRAGCPVADLIYFVVMGSDQAFRRRYFYQLMDHYYGELTLALQRLGITAEDVYGKGEFDSDLRDKLPYGICIAAMGLPFVTVAPAHAPNFGSGHFVPRPNELFAERFRALVEDFKLWGII